ncbi:DUF2905 family protein [Cupriavidus metallidurans]|jgi:Protein of unknown function (DUF2905)|uniref:DUF2905 domain-containing protein n=2 Tax=Cupriavidus metallidurans TaxID=119219 RepID=Q1LS10_CUPMC|nr:MULTISPECIES: DUF2905 domain-containing protein [Cupriavidus]PCH54643.1 MAG: DUF2905 domain-containing protein [Burkholderiaceae bacterium]ABF07066.1 conserved hypothetical protein; putative exported protein [Cupriavidus metallidurans CH34]AVA32290.1 DUF2905 domain-containing protein [Cupriavidus metallidurans]ELA00977.1 hypothetical protein D769_02693 [Cupriavidus sp. HMR-1]KWR80436.1 hypothetical protein RN01_18280 [Cupriavidus sp. SHE]
MLRWTFTIFLCVIVLSASLPWLQKIGLGRLPGDVRFRLFGREYVLPFASTILLSLAALVIGKLL